MRYGSGFRKWGILFGMRGSGGGSGFGFKVWGLGFYKVGICMGLGV